MSKTKAGGSTRNGRDSESKRLGTKVFDGQDISAGSIVVRQRGTKIHPGENVSKGGDDTLFDIDLTLTTFTSSLYPTLLLFPVLFLYWNILIFFNFFSSISSKSTEHWDKLFLSVTIDPFLGLSSIGFIDSNEKLFGTSKISPSTTFSCLEPTSITAYLLITQLLYYGIWFK